MFATTLTYTPLFNTKTLSKVFLNYDEHRLVREIEMVLFPKSKVQILSEEGGVLEIITEEYASAKSLYIDKRFIEYAPFAKERKKQLPSKQKMLEALQRVPKLPYIWGGNTFCGIPELLEYYPPKGPLSDEDLLYWQLKGVDCSGLLYAITNGATPRNSAEIFDAYPEVSSLRPLDLIVWKGHLIIVLSATKVIESRHREGIVVSNLETRLKEVEAKHPKFLRFM